MAIVREQSVNKIGVLYNSEHGSMLWRILIFLPAVLDFASCG